MARPSLYDPALADVILDRLSEGESLRAICSTEGMPSRSTVFRWLADDEGFATKYAHAREAQAEVHHEDMDDIEARTLTGELPPQAASVVLANKRWRMEKLKPRVYGNKVEHDHRGKLTLEQLVTGHGSGD